MSDHTQTYAANRPTYDRLLEEVLFAVSDAVEREGIKTHSIVGRVKDFTSFASKAERKEYAEPFDETEDMVGARVVCLFLSDLPRLRKVIGDTFTVLSEEDKVEGGAAEDFGYMSLHLICALKADHVGPRYSGLHGVKVEIQLRTILMDAWANVSHHLDYKGEASIPENLQRDFFALSGLFYVADKHFELFFQESQISRKAAVAGIEKRDANSHTPVNLDTMLAFLRTAYPERRRSAPHSVSEFVEEVVAHGYHTIEQLDAVLRPLQGAAEEYEKAHPPLGPNRTFKDLGMARTALAIADPGYARRKHPNSAGRFADYRPG